MKVKYNATIYFDTKKNHPDLPSAEYQSFSDIYTIETDSLWGEPLDYIKGDLRLIAGGGYRTDTIENVRFYISKA